VSLRPAADTNEEDLMRVHTIVLSLCLAACALACSSSERTTTTTGSSSAAGGGAGGATVVTKEVGKTSMQRSRRGRRHESAARAPGAAKQATVTRLAQDSGSR
jgi:hypothetical protein